jgi:hypothetical protein
MNEQIIQQLKDAVRDVVSMIVKRGQPLSPELKQMLSQVIEHVTQRIMQLKQEESPADGLSPLTGQQPELAGGGPSSNINSFGYDDKTGRLLVKFQGDYPQENGPTYAYEGVPKPIFELFRKGAVPARTDGQNKWGKWWKGKVPSLGASMFTLIKNGGYQYSKLS